MKNRLAPSLLTLIISLAGACGAHARDCGFWGAVLTRWSASVPDFTEREYRGLQRRFERLRHLLRPGFRRELNIENPRFARYAEYTRSLFDAIADLSGAEVIVDSSKSPARALARALSLSLSLVSRSNRRMALVHRAELPSGTTIAAPPAVNGISPESLAMTGMPQANASMSIRPNCSFHFTVV